MTSPTLLPDLTLTGRFVRLEPLGPEHAQALAEAGAEARDTYAWAPVPGTPDEALAYIATRLASREAGTWMSFATRRLADDRVVGSTSFLNIETWGLPTGDGRPDSVEIGSTWLAASAQRSPLNTEAKLLMMTQAFDVWEVQRLQIKTDTRNRRSRDAIERLGATFEGVLRRYQAAQGDVGQGGVRDTAMYSVIAEEWPAVQAGLAARLDHQGDTGA